MRVHGCRSVLLASLTAAIVALAGGLAAHAQGTTSRVVGTVTDSTGAVLPGAVVTLTNDQTGVTFETVTTGTGNYTFEAVQVGRYTVAVQLPGFKRFVSSANEVNVGEPTTINAVLETGTIEEAVEVRASSQVVQTSTSGNVGSTFDQRTIESLPILGGRGRNPIDLVLSQPGVVSGANTGGGVHVNGARDRSWNFTLDGIDVNESSAGGSNFAPLRTNPDSLAEFRVLTSNVTAEFGRNSGGQVAMITRSGTNELRGSLFYFDRRPEYNANEYQNNLNQLPKREFTQQMPGFSIGGPIRRNRTFFFANTQWLRADQTQRRTRTVLTEQARRGLWRFATSGRNQPAGVGGASVDASGNPVVPIGTYDIAAGDPQRLGLDPEVQRLIALTPLPNNFTVGDGLNTAGFTWAAPEEERQYDFVAKIDHVINNRHNVFARIAKGQQDTICDQVNDGEPVFPGGPCVVNTERSPYNWAGNWRWNPGGSIVNELVIGQNHFTFDFRNPNASPTAVTFTGLPMDLSNPEDFTTGNLRSIDTFQIVDNFSYARGAHTLKFGTNMRFQRHTDERGSVAGLNVSPRLNFSTGVNTVDPATFGIPSMNTTFDRPNLQGLINFMLGRVGSINQGFVQRGSGYAPGGTTFLFEAQYPELDFYAQDTWRIRPTLTLDAGLRWELKMAPSNPDNLIRRPNQRVAVGAAPSSSLEWVQGDLFDDDVNNFGPSVGVAWDPMDDGKNVVRANYRLAYDRLNTFVLSSRIFQSTPGITTGVVDTSFGQAGGRLRQGLPSLAPTVSPEDFVRPPAVSSNSTTVMDPEFQAAQTHGWLLSYQRELWSRTLLEVSYIGRRGENLFGAYDVNQAEFRNNGFLDAFNVVRAGGQSALMNQLLQNDSRRRSSETGSDMVRRLFASTLNLGSVAALADSLASRVQGGRTLPELAGLDPFFFFPYPQFLGGVSVLDSNDYSRFHALQLKLDRRFANGYSYLVAYTLSQSKDTRSYDPAFTVVSTGALQSASSTPFDIHNRDLNFARSDFDRTHVFQFQWVAELPFGEGHRFASNAGPVLNAIIGGWQLSGQLLLQSGRPFTIYSGTNTLSNVVQTPANCSNCSGNEAEVFFDPSRGTTFYFTEDEVSRFGAPGPGEFSNMGRNAFEQDGLFRVNMSLAKRTRLFGDHMLEFRVDSTNVTNTPSFGLPSSSIFTSGVFGRVRDNVVSDSRKVMLGLKYSF